MLKIEDNQEARETNALVDVPKERIQGATMKNGIIDK